MVPEKRDIQQIEFPDEADAKAARAKIAAGTVSFEALAAERKISSPGPVAGHAGQSRPADQARADAAFALPLNEVSQPVKGASTAMCCCASPRSRPASRNTLDDVKDQIRKKLALQLAGAKLTDIVNAFEDARSRRRRHRRGGEESRHAISAASPRWTRTGSRPTAARPTLPADPEFLATVFKAEVGEDSDPFPTKSGAYYAIKVDGVTPAKLKPLDQVRAEAIAAWTAEEKRQGCLPPRPQRSPAEAEKDGNPRRRSPRS